MPVRRTRDYKLRYTTDLFYNKLIVQRTFVDRDNATVLTPITPSFLNRVITDDNILEPVNNLKARNVETCFININNLLGESKFNVIIPYNPDQIEHSTHINELENFPGVHSAAYYGESFTTNLLDYL